MFRKLIGITLLLGSLSAQDAPPLIRSTSRLVLLDVVVTDKTGRPLPGLTKDDFTILENGAPQKIASFEAVSAGGSGPEGNGARNIILLDELNIEFQDLAYVRNQIVMFLDHTPVETQPTALMAIGSHGLTMVEDFTRDSQRLKDTLAHLSVFNANPKGGIDTDTDLTREHAQSALRALSQIARASAGSPHTLNVIWVTRGFPGLVRAGAADSRSESQLRAVATQLIRSRMRLYTIDPAGVVPLATLAGAAEVSRGDIRDVRESSAANLLKSAHGEQTTSNGVLGYLTSMLGGLSYFGRNDVNAVLNQAILDGSSSYLISYSPLNTSFDGEYRKIQVHTNIADSTARTRNGYYAVPDEAAADRGMAEALWTAALASPLAYTGLDVSCPVTFDASTNRIKGKVLTTPRQKAVKTDQKEQIFRVASFSEDRKLLDSWSWRITWKDSWTSKVVGESFDKVLSPKARTVRFLVSDPGAEQMGTCEYRLR
jgi:VWFA-related protein